MLNQKISHPLYQVLSKDTIESEIVPYIPLGKEVLNQKFLSVRLLTLFYINLRRIFSGIFYLYYNCSVKKFFTTKQFLATIANGVKLGYGKTAGAVGYQGRKKRKTTNALYLTDRSGLPLAMSMPFCGNHNDLFNIEEHFEELTDFSRRSGISLDGLF